MKTCSKCKSEKSLDDFSIDRSRKSGRFPQCKQCVRESSKAWRSLNAEKQREYRQANRDRQREHQREWAERNRESERERLRKYAEENREKVRAAKTKYRKANPLKINEHTRKRTAIKAGAAIERVSYGAILERDGFHCHICDRGIGDRSEVHFDHVIPLSRGGAHSMDNVKVAHAKCNLSKGAKVLSSGAS